MGANFAVVDAGAGRRLSRKRDTEGEPLAPDLPMVPAGWEERLISYFISAVTARCLEIHDLIVTKLAAGRLKDYEFIAAILMGKLARVDEVQRRILLFSDPHTQAVLLA